MENFTCFKAYDIRGLWGEEINENIAYRIGRAYAMFLQPKCVVVGQDVRLSGKRLKAALSQGLQDSGVDVYDIGLSGTEEIYFATFHYKMDGGIAITASHNPANYNGMKLVREKAQPISADSGLLTIKALAEKNAFPLVNENQRGGNFLLSILNDYVQHLINYIDGGKIKPLKLVINVGNGAAGHVIDEIERHFEREKIPVTLIKVNAKPDGNFPNGVPNPLLPECREQTTDAVLSHRADMGIAFDGDFDRCFFFDEKGNFIESYYIVGLLAHACLAKQPDGKIIHDPRLYWNTLEMIKVAKGMPIMSKSGHAFIKERMRNEDAIYGGEMSGHHYFRDFSYCDSGMIPWLLMMGLLSKSDMPLSELVKERMQAYPVSGEINLFLSNPLAALENIRRQHEKHAKHIDNTDGISIEYENWRFNLRASNTEPLVRLNVEAKSDPQLMQEKTEEILVFLKE